MKFHFFEEFIDEISDVFEDTFELLVHHKHSTPKVYKSTRVDGTLVKVRPAYLFAERIENSLKLIFGVSIMFSAVTASFVGFTSLSGLLEELIDTLWGKSVMIIIGASYTIIGLWKVLRLGSEK